MPQIPNSNELNRLAQQDAESYTESKAKWANWLWRLYGSTSDEEAAEARDMLIAAINHQHDRGRAMVSRARGRFTFTRRSE